jgi:hypothetical protein
VDGIEVVGAARRPYLVAADDPIPADNVDRVEIRQSGHHSPAVVDAHRQPPGHGAGEGHHAGRNGGYRFARLGRVVDSPMPGVPAHRCEVGNDRTGHGG